MTTRKGYSINLENDSNRLKALVNILEMVPEVQQWGFKARELYNWLLKNRELRVDAKDALHLKIAIQKLKSNRDRLAHFLTSYNEDLTNQGFCKLTLTLINPTHDLPEGDIIINPPPKSLFLPQVSLDEAEDYVKIFFPDYKILEMESFNFGQLENKS